MCGLGPSYSGVLFVLLFPHHTWVRAGDHRYHGDLGSSGLSTGRFSTGVPDHCLWPKQHQFQCVLPFFILVSTQKPEDRPPCKPVLSAQNNSIQPRERPALQPSPYIPQQSRGTQEWGCQATGVLAQRVRCLPGKHEDLNLDLQHSQKSRAQRCMLVTPALAVGYEDRHTEEFAGQTDR